MSENFFVYLLFDISDHLLVADLNIREKIILENCFIPTDTGRKLSVQKTFRRCLGRLLNVLCTFSLRPVSAWIISSNIVKLSGFTNSDIV